MMQCETEEIYSGAKAHNQILWYGDDQRAQKNYCKKCGNSGTPDPQVPQEEICRYKRIYLQILAEGLTSKFRGCLVLWEGFY